MVESPMHAVARDYSFEVEELNKLQKYIATQFGSEIRVFESASTSSKADENFKKLYSGLLEKVLAIVPNDDERAQYCVSAFASQDLSEEAVGNGWAKVLGRLNELNGSVAKSKSNMIEQMHMQGIMDMHKEGEIDENKDSVVGFMNQMQNEFNKFFLKANEDASLTGNELRAYQ
jgi:hypothetical protein